MNTSRRSKYIRGMNRGVTILELVLATFLAFVVVMSMAKIILANSRAFSWGKDKLELQQNVTEAMEQVARSVRAADSLTVTSSDIRTYDKGHAQIHRYQFVQVAGSNPPVYRIREDGRDLIARDCMSYAIRPQNDTTSVIVTFEFRDNSGNKVAAKTRAAIRNHTFPF